MDRDRRRRLRRRFFLARYWLRRARRFLVHDVLHADDPIHRLALAVAIGMWVMFTPTIGAQTLLVFCLSWLLGANKIVGLPVVWLSNPITLVPIYYPSYWLGRHLVGGEKVDADWWIELAKPPMGWVEMVEFYWAKFLVIAEPLWAGCFIVATLVGAVTYCVTYAFLRWYRLKRFGQLVPPQKPVHKLSHFHHESDGEAPATAPKRKSKRRPTKRRGSRGTPPGRAKPLDSPSTPS